MTLRWSGHRISPEARTVDPLTSGLHGGPGGGSFSRSLFRRRFELRDVPALAPAQLTADSRYVLWVNGQELGRGPARSQPFPAAVRRLRPGAVPGRWDLALALAELGQVADDLSGGPAVTRSGQSERSMVR